MTFETYTLQVYGYAWGGFRRTYEYKLKPERAAEIIARADPSRDAGDFASLIGWRVVKSCSSYERMRGGRRHVQEWRTVKTRNAAKIPSRAFG